MSYVPFSRPSIRSCVEGGIFDVGTIVTCRPWAANRPSVWAMYRPAESMAGNASTTMFVFSSLRGAPPPDPPEEHPAAIVMTATADAMSTFRDFILAPSGMAASLATPRPAGRAPRSAAAPKCVTEHHNVLHRPSHVER